MTTAVDLVRRFLLRHPVLRSSITVLPDGTPVQRVRAEGTVPVRLFEDAGAEWGRLWETASGTTPTDFCRPLLLLNEGLVVQLIMRVSHFATDGWGRQILADDLADFPLAGDLPATKSPIDLAALENSSEGEAMERRAVAFAAVRYADCPPTTWLRDRRRPDAVRFWYGELRSAALLDGLELLSRKKRLGWAGMLCGALAAVSSARAGLDSALLFTISSNRFTQGDREYPGPLSQEAILHLPIKGTVTETMRAAGAESMRSVQVARYAPAAMRALCARFERDRGVCFDKLGSAIIVNLLAGVPRRGPRAEDGPGPTTFEWYDSTHHENLGFYVDAFPADSQFVLRVRVDTTRLSLDEAEAWLRTIEWLVVTTAERDIPAAEVQSVLADLLGCATVDPGQLHIS
ncbi:hypothetical protein [Amycolatopsis xylanica]|uniref:hypothetical protein n=1 Tax=Amycolatopsis xylanica TaxID=589385 RepID=UPI0015A304F9|nr:hypothetical protein [Amycolatopsis xylanica]